MGIPLKTIPPEVLTEVRRLYERTNVHLDDIAAIAGIAPSTLSRRIRQWGWKRRSERIPRAGPDPAGEGAHGSGTESASATPAGEAAAAIEEGIMLAIEKQVEAIERVVANLNASPPQAVESERAARSLASLSRTLAEIRTLRTARMDARADDRDGFPENLDALRQELAARIERLAAGAAGGVLQQPEPGD